MHLTDVRASLQSRLTSLFRRQTKNEISNVGDDRWLSPQEAAHLLQPHMPNRNALAWLELDRNIDPSLPFLQQRGEVAYRLADVRAFVRRMSKNHSSSGEKVLSTVEFPDRRKGGDRRAGGFTGAANERRQVIDRRSGFDRRVNSDRRKRRDDFGYGRNGDRRGMPPAI